MSFTKKSEKLIDFFINDIDLFFKERTKKNQKIYNNILNILYQDIFITDKYVNFLSKKNKIKFIINDIMMKELRQQIGILLSQFWLRMVWF